MITLDRWDSVHPDDPDAIPVTLEQYRDLIFGRTISIQGAELSIDDGPFIVQSGDVVAVERGGPGSGHHDHAGRPGEVGGSAPSGKSPAKGAKATADLEEWRPSNLELVTGLEPITEEQMQSMTDALEHEAQKIPYEKVTEILDEIELDEPPNAVTDQSGDPGKPDVRPPSIDRPSFADPTTREPLDLDYKTINQDADAIRKSKVEQGFYYTSTGERIELPTGNEWGIDVPDDVEQKIRSIAASGADVAMLHNHPSGGSFSPADIIFAVETGVSEMRVSHPWSDYPDYVMRINAKAINKSFFNDKIMPYWDNIYHVEFNNIAVEIPEYKDRYTEQAIHDRNVEASRRAWEQIEKKWPDWFDYEEVSRANNP